MFTYLRCVAFSGAMDVDMKHRGAYGDDLGITSRSILQSALVKLLADAVCRTLEHRGSAALLHHKSPSTLVDGASDAGTHPLTPDSAKRGAE